MQVTFRRTAPRRYAIDVEVPGRGVGTMDPAPGYDDDLPHDLVHYLVEAELGLTGGVFGRAAAGGGGFVPRLADGGQDRRRVQRRQRTREARLRRADHARGNDMAASERLAGLCHQTWRHHEIPLVDPPTPEEQQQLARIAPHLERAARAWRATPVGGTVTFTWPATAPL